MSDDTTTIDAARTAVLIMDYQAGILGRFDGAERERLLGNAERAIAAARAAGATVGYVRVAFTEDDRADVPPHSRFAAMLDGPGVAAFDADAPGTQIDARIAPQPSDIVVRKTRIGAFSTTDLQEQLRTRDIDTLVLGGISTSGVTLSTVCDAADRDYRLFVLADVTADFDADAHRVLMDNVFPRQATVIESTDLAAAFAD